MSPRSLRSARHGHVGRRLASAGALGATLATLGLALTACGSDEATALDPSATSSAPNTTGSDPSSASTSGGTSSLPACDTVWVAGQNLPRTYRGCTDASGATVAAQKHSCSLGVPIVEYGDRFYAVAGNKINEIADLHQSSQFRSALQACQA